MTETRDKVIFFAITIGSILAIRSRRLDVQLYRYSALINPSAVADIAASLPANEDDFIIAAWEYVASNVQYENFGSILYFTDQGVECDECFTPLEVLAAGESNCVGKSILLTSILRNRIPPDRVYMAVGTLNLNSNGGHAWCFPSNTKINCLGQTREIASLKPGDEILTGRGKIGVVDKVMNRLYDGELVILKYSGRGIPLQVTTEHPILTATGWKPAGAVCAGEYVVEPILQETDSTLSIKVKFGDGYVDVPLNKDTLRLAGYYLAEGTLQAGNRKDRPSKEARVIWYFNSKETDYLDDVCDILRSQFGVASWRTPYHSGTTMRIETKSRVAFEFLKLFGRGARNKEMPKWALLLPRGLQSELIKGLFRGDGCVSTSNKGQWTENRINLSSCSPHLIEDTHQILLRMGIDSGIYLYPASKRVREGYYGCSGDQYRLNVQGQKANELATILGISLPEIHGKKHQTYFRQSKLGVCALHRVQSVKRISVLNLPVYNIEVAKKGDSSTEDNADPSYVANGIAVHNCRVERDGKWYVLEPTLMPSGNPWIPEASVAYKYALGGTMNDKSFSCSEPGLCLAVKKTSCIPYVA